MLILYEGDAASPNDAKVRVRLVDFAHTFFQRGGSHPARALLQDGGTSAVPQRGASPGGGAPASRPQQRRRRDINFLAGLRALLARLRGVVHTQLQAELA